MIIETRINCISDKNEKKLNDNSGFNTFTGHHDQWKKQIEDKQCPHRPTCPNYTPLHTGDKIEQIKDIDDNLIDRETLFKI